MSSLPSVCVIGAGQAGLTACKALRDHGVPVQGFEISDRVGGNWAFQNPNGMSSAYRSLHIDTPKSRLAFKDLPMPAEWPDFLHHTLVYEYLCRYADTFGLREHIRFQTAVRHAERLPGGGWEVSVGPADSPHASERLRFDALLVANGHHWNPRLPEPPFPGEFHGQTLHSHHYIDPYEPIDCRGKRVLVVGIGNSAADIASELSHRAITARTFLSTRSGAWVIPLVMFGQPLTSLIRTLPYVPLKWQRRAAHWMVRLTVGDPRSYGLPMPDHRVLEAHPTASNELLWRLRTGDLVAKPDVRGLEGDRVAFADGSAEQIDVIIYATGYKITFPFFEESFISAPENRLALFKRVFRPEYPDLAFIGLCQAIPTLFEFCELQSKWVASYLAGKYRLPAPAAMAAAIEHDERVQTRHFTARPRHTMQADADVYARDLRKEWTAGRRRAVALGPQLRAASAQLATA